MGTFMRLLSWAHSLRPDELLFAVLAAALAVFILWCLSTWIVAQFNVNAAIAIAPPLMRAALVAGLLVSVSPTAHAAGSARVQAVDSHAPQASQSPTPQAIESPIDAVNGLELPERPEVSGPEISMPKDSTPEVSMPEVSETDSDAASASPAPARPAPSKSTPTRSTPAPQTTPTPTPTGPTATVPSPTADNPTTDSGTTPEFQATPSTQAQASQPTAPTGSSQESDRHRGRYTVQPGDSLWRIAAAHLGHQASNRDISEAVTLWYGTNREVIGANPDLIHPGQQLKEPTP